MLIARMEVKSMKFICKSGQDAWDGVICNLIKRDNVYEFWIKSRSSIMVILGPTSRGGFACFPDFKVGCHLTNLKNEYWNTEQLVEILGKVDGLTVSAALTKLSKTIPLIF